MAWKSSKISGRGTRCQTLTEGQGGVFPGTAGVSPASSRYWAERPGLLTGGHSCRRSADSSGQAGEDAGAPREGAPCHVWIDPEAGRAALTVVAIQNQGISKTSAARPAPGKTLHFERGGLHFQRGGLSFERGALHFERGALSIERGALHFERGAPPFERTGPPLSVGDAVLLGDGTFPLPPWHSSRKEARPGHSGPGMQPSEQETCRCSSPRLAVPWRP